MIKLISSASKLVFIIITVASCAGFFMGRLSESNFMILAGSTFTFYFASKGEGGQPFGGK